MKIKAGVWQWLGMACLGVGMVFGLGFAGNADALGIVSDREFITAMVLLGAAGIFFRLYEAAEEREERQRRMRRRCRALREQSGGEEK